MVTWTGIARREHSRDLARFVDRHTADAEQFSAVMVRVEACPELVALGKDGHGRGRFSTRAMIGVEQRLEDEE